ncbi:putative ferric-chelate reductase 1 [Rhopilema esculentum]|uniref:putative ferric-chelate reductase 1 n=1 Tax=Rhopilema esculentum TaxID=499914 RepID=UPI0031D33033
MVGKQVIVAFSLIFFEFILANGQELTADGCGKAVNCFKSSSCKSSTNCDYFVQFQYNASASMVSFAIGGKHSWIALGLRDSKQLTMDGNIGEACVKDGVGAKLLFFNTVGKKATFSPHKGLVDVEALVINGSILCRYKRSIATPSGTTLRNLASSWYLTSAYGNRIVTGEPQYHDSGNYATSSSRIDFMKVGDINTKSWEISALLLAHGILGIFAWGLFAGIGIFIARYMKAALGDKIWFPAHRIIMIVTTIMSSACMVTIFVKLKGWNAEYAGAHAYTGVIAHLLAIIQMVAGNLRPKKSSNKRGIFNVGHRSIGVIALVLAGITILLGCKLVEISIVPSIIWFVFVFLVVIAMEKLSCSYSKTGKNVEVNMDTQTDEKKEEQSLSENAKRIYKGMLALVVVVLLSIAIATAVLFGTKNIQHSHG